MDIATRKVNPKVVTIWIVPPKIEIKPTFDSFFMSICKPTMNKRNAIPISDIVAITEVLVIMPINGPKTTPVRMYAGINGCLKSRPK